MKKNILIISIYYPPIESIASNRIYSFAKYLDKDKYNIFVHTIRQDKPFKNDLEGVKVSRVKNNSFLKPLQFNKRTNKFVHYLKVAYNILIKKITKNIYQKWIDESFEYLKKEIKKENIDLIISSYAPDASHILALKLKQEFPNTKWIADFRDEMSQNPYINTSLKDKYLKLEQQIFKNANAITSVSKPILDDFKQMSKNRALLFREIRNGYDFEASNNNAKNKTFTITYMGNFYGDITPINFFKALEFFVSNNKDIIVKLVGVKTHFEIPNSIKESVEILPQVKHLQAIELIKQSDALLLIYPTNGRKGVYTGKLFEYLGALRPIIALIDEQDVAATLIKEANAGYISDNANVEKITSILNKAYLDWKNGIIMEYNIDIIKKHHRLDQTKRLELLIDELLNER